MKTKKYYQTPATLEIKVNAQLLNGNMPSGSDTPSGESGGQSRQQRSDWGED